MVSILALSVTYGATSPKGRGFQEAPLLLFRGRHGILGKEKPADRAGKRRMVS